MKENLEFFAIKLTTAETLFAEVTVVGENDIVIRKPLIVKDIPIDGDSSLVAQAWLPYVEDDSALSIPTDMIFLFEPLNEKFVRFYGSILMQIEVQKIKSETVDVLDGSDADRWMMKEAVDRINATSEYMSEKFGIDRVDVSKFEEKASKENMLLH